MRVFIQPYLGGTELKIFVSTDKNGSVKTKTVDLNGKTFKLKQCYLKDVKKCYSLSKFYRYDIVLFCNLVFDALKQKEKLVFTDILLRCNYDGIQQSMRYNVRHENLVSRFFTIDTKHCSVVQSFDTEDEGLMKIFETTHFKMSTELDTVTYHLDVPYGESGEVHSSVVAHLENMKIVGGKVGVTKVEAKDSSEENPKTEEKEFVESFICTSEYDTNEVYVDLTPMPMKDKIEMMDYFEKSIEGRTCKCLVYSFYRHSGITFVEMS